MRQPARLLVLLCVVVAGCWILCGPARADGEGCHELCHRHAEEALHACLEQGEGTDPAQCEERFIAVLEECLVSECDGEEPPPPPPPPGCQDLCHQRAEEAFHACLLQGEGTDPAQCEERFIAVLEECLASECEEPPPPPPPPDCHELCHRHAEEAMHACLEQGEGTDPAQCEERFIAVLEECLVSECDGEEPPPPPPPPGCQDLCHQRAEEAFHACLLQGEGTDPAQCEERFIAVLEECLASECEEPPPPPPPPDCHELCHRHAEEAMHACLEQGEGTDPAQCEERFIAVLEECLVSECEDPEPPPPPDCHELCHLRAEEALHACMEQGNGADPTLCEETFRAVLEECLAGACDGEEPPPDPGCEHGCREHSREAFKACIEDGGMEGECAHVAELALHECLETCPPPPPPEPTCEQRCERTAEDAVLQCLEAGMDPEECEARRARVLEECLPLCEGPPPPPDPDCKERCRRHASEVTQVCLEAGLSQEECAAQGEEALVDCLRETCPPEPPDDPTCENHCEAHAAEVARLCAEEGLSEEVCQLKIEEAFRNCVLRCGDDGEPPPDKPCEARCEERAAAVFQDCLADGGDEEACRELSMGTYRECVQNCDGEEEPPLPKPCDEECVQRGESVYLACREAGGDEGDCRKQADAIVALCLERCGVGNPCEDRCALAAQIVLAGCSLGQLPEAECTGIANMILERCVTTCEPPVSCEDECTRLARLAVEECVARGGSAEECAGKGEQLAENCIAHCEGEPVEPCDTQCGEKARELEESCLADGAEPGRCAELAARFEAECLREHGEDCVRDAQLGMAAFQPFVRGDADRDGDLDITDPIIVLGHLFLGEQSVTCEDAADANDDGGIDVADPITVLSYLFQGGAALPEPREQAGQDPTIDELACAP